MASMAWSILVLVGVLAAIPLSLGLLRRLQGGLAGTGERPLTLAGQLTLGPRERVVLVRHGDRELVLGVTAQQITLLAEGEAPPPSAGASAPPPPGFAALLRQQLGRGS